MKFLRRDSNRYSKLGKNRKKKQKWIAPKGRDNKMREKRKGYPAVVSIGYCSDKKQKGKINGKIPLVVRSLKDLEKATKENILLTGKLGDKKKYEIAKKAKEMKLEFENFNIKKFMKKIEHKNKKIEKNSVKKEDKKSKDKVKENKK